jgi:hypothetical protein
MAREQCFQQLLNQIVRSVVDGNIPAMAEVVKLHTFLSQLDALETYSPAYALEALGDWVPRLLKGIADSSLVIITHPPVMLQSSIQQSTHFMDLVEDAIATVPFQSSASNSEPRFKVVEIFNHKIEDGTLAYWVRWEGNDYYDLEVYKNLYHLTIFEDYEEKIKPSSGRVRGVKSRVALENYRQYITHRDREASSLTEEFDTDEDDDQVITLHPAQLPTPMEQLASDDSMSWGSLLVAEDDSFYMPSNLDLGGSFGEAGPSHQEELFNWKELDEKLGAPGH